MNPLTRRAIRIFVFVGIGLPIFAKLVTPWFIEQAYQGKSLGFLNAFISGQANHPLSFYLNEWAIIFWPIMWAYIFGGLLAVFLFDVMTRPTVYDRFFIYIRNLMMHGKSAFRVLLVLTFTMVSGYAAPVFPHVAVTISETQVGAITLGTGWSTWDFWWQQYIPRFRLTWTDEQWNSYFKLLGESGGDWIRADLYYGDTEPRNDNNDPEIINWDAFTFDSPKLKSLYKLLDYSQANGIDVTLTYTYLRSNHDYNADRLTGWLSKEAVSKGFPELWTRPKDEPIDTRELAENLAATTYHLLKNRKYTCIKQVSLYVEPAEQWTNVDGFLDTKFLGRLLVKLGIRDQVAILAPQTTAHVDSQDGDYDVFAIEDYGAVVNWATPEKGLQSLDPIYKGLVSRIKRMKPPMEVGLTEYGRMLNEGATGPLPSFLSTLSAACLVFELYNSGFAGTQRWAFDPLYHPYCCFGVISVEGVLYPPVATEVTFDTTVPIIAAMKQGAKFIKVPQTFEPQRLINTNLPRGSTVHQVEVYDPIRPGKGIYAIAARNESGKWRVGLVNLYASVRDVEVFFPADSLPDSLVWEYYDATMPQHTLQGSPPKIRDHSLILRMPPRSLSFLRDQSVL